MVLSLGGLSLLRFQKSLPTAARGVRRRERIRAAHGRAPRAATAATLQPVEARNTSRTVRLPGGERPAPLWLLFLRGTDHWPRLRRATPLRPVPLPAPPPN